MSRKYTPTGRPPGRPATGRKATAMVKVDAATKERLDALAALHQTTLGEMIARLVNASPLY